MIRFLADTWRDALLRPVAMAAPNNSVYIEIAAPDFRFVLALGLIALVLISARKIKPDPRGWRPTLALSILIFFSFISWMQTTGNGRYFMPFLLFIGPLCIALINLLPSTTNMKAFLVVLVIGTQGMALYQNSPWEPHDSWGWLPWKEAPYFSIELPQEGLDPNTTYLTPVMPTYSLVAPLFPASVHWINLAAFEASETGKDSKLYAPVKKALQDGKSLKLFFVASPRAMIKETVQPNEKAIASINSYIEAHDLRLKIPTDCLLAKSKSLSFSQFIDTDEKAEEKARYLEQSGFWICTVEYSVSQNEPRVLTTEEVNAKALFEKMEHNCPDFFAPGQETLRHHSAGFQRRYLSSDSYLIATTDGHLYFKYDRALNPQLIGKAEDVLSPGFTYDCTKFKGRAGLPWEREI